MIACHLLYTPTCGMRHMACGIWHVACHSHVVRISKKLNKYNNLKRKYAKSIAAASETFHNITKWHRHRRVMRSRARVINLNDLLRPNATELADNHHQQLR
ncbi:unnamed protein product [Ceratitis capitata]|uniref:(Mediterranean fruit fly) hypothetical protein n=1 Tax=Ceratitis capitata TaxID=7213 RepID=A0A811UT53_CERCA|nr:unnamed protein product [Ceratitis capitata]